ncbi:potassium channel family protein [Companilactobacillus musae]|uniref:potassium channel family protein n=1 Tax=Companilactobacillus musae TaxID=1903258 RepID=UPI000E657866|nr:potassium channel family protein [Companilactobacillus musae]
MEKLLSNQKVKSGYYFIIILAGTLSLVTLFLGFVHGINIDKPPFVYIDDATLLIFTVDYFGRFFYSKNKWQFFTHNIVDLLAIIPFNSIFSTFRVFRMFRIFRVLKLSRIFMFIRFIGVSGKFRKNILRFLKINGLIYLIVISILALLISAILYSLSEGISLSNALWWAIVTATTVGYGDISPHTLIGRIASVILMFVGVGFIGTLTSSISSYFIQNHTADNDNSDEILSKLADLTRENKELHEDIKKLESKIDNINK